MFAVFRGVPTILLALSVKLTADMVPAPASTSNRTTLGDGRQKREKPMVQNNAVAPSSSAEFP